jgi:hypothetical protein
VQEADRRFEARLPGAATAFWMSRVYPKGQHRVHRVRPWPALPRPESPVLPQPTQPHPAEAWHPRVIVSVPSIRAGICDIQNPISTMSTVSLYALDVGRGFVIGHRFGNRKFDHGVSMPSMLRSICQPTDLPSLHHIPQVSMPSMSGGGLRLMSFLVGSLPIGLTGACGDAGCAEAVGGLCAGAAELREPHECAKPSLYRRRCFPAQP